VSFSSAGLLPVATNAPGIPAAAGWTPPVVLSIAAKPAWILLDAREKGEFRAEGTSTSGFWPSAS
jgi:hypothetical protein